MSEPGRAVLVGGGCLLAVPVLVLAAPHLDGLPAGPGALIGWLSSPPVDGHLLTLLALLTWGCVLWLLVGVGVSA